MSNFKESKCENEIGEKIEQSTHRIKYPKVVLLIILSELCERFSFYGLRAILYIFFTEFLCLSSNFGTVLYHAHSIICFFCPILG